VTRMILPSSYPEVARRAGSSLVDPSSEERSLLIDPVEHVVSLGTVFNLELDRGPARTLQQVVDAAKKLLDADGVGLMLADTNGQLRQASASNQQVQNIEEHQDRAALGLCAAALAKRTPICIRDVHQDPDSYGLRMVLNETQIVAALSVPLELDGHPIGTLSVYSGTPRDWDAKEINAVQAYAGIVASLLAAAAAAHVKARLAAQLQTALDRRMVIEQAKGILMAKEGIDAATAFQRLRTGARSTRRRMVDVAHDLTAGRPLPQPRPPPHLERARRDRVAQAPASPE
jgi:transcriptional regulator with GAF, ATPase, and Fis domain